MSVHDMDEFSRLVKEAEESKKEMIRSAYFIYKNDYYKPFGYSSFNDFATDCMHVPYRTALWLIQLWHTVEECKKAGMAWVEDLPLPTLNLIARKTPEEIRKMLSSKKKGFRYKDISAAVARYDNDVEDRRRKDNPAEKEIERELADGAINPEWMCQWIRDNAGIVKRFLDEECWE